MSSSASILEVIGHYQRSIEKSQKDERLLYCINKLAKLPVTVKHLQDTGVGKTVNSLRKYNGEVGIASKSLVTKWKTMVAAEEDTTTDIEVKPNIAENIPMCNNNKNDKNYDGSIKESSIKKPPLSYDNENFENSHQGESNNSQHSKHHKPNSGDRIKDKSNINKEKRRENREDTAIANKKTAVEDDDDDKLVIDVNNGIKTEETENIIITETSKIQSPDKLKSDKKEKSTKSSHDHRREHNTSEHSKNHHSPKDKSLKEKHKDAKSKSSREESSKNSHSEKREHKKHKNDKEKKKDNETVTSKDKHEHNQKGESSREKDKVKSKHRDREHHKKPKSHDQDKPKHTHEDVSKHKRKLSDSDSSSSLQKKPKPSKTNDEPEFDSSMGASFEDVLGMCNYPSSSKSPKKPMKSSQSASYSTEKNFSRADKGPVLLSSNIKLEPLDPTIALSLPAISTNYRPMPLNQTVMDCVFSSNKPKRTLTDEEALSHGISSKTMRTKVYSGVRTGALFQVPSLFDICIRILQKNIDALEYTGGIPFEVLRPVLERASPQQLLNFEEFNPYLLEDSDFLWEQHCNRHYRSQKREEFESWREMFWRCKENQDNRLSLLAENIKLSQKQTSLPIRKTQLAFVDSMVKPPRSIQRKQDQFGTKQKPIATPASRVAALSIMTPNAAKIGDTRLRLAPNARDNAQVTAIKPKKAPLMQKALQSFKGRFKR